MSPALVEGPLDYDFEAFATTTAQRTKDATRDGARHAVCMAIHQSVWEQIGYFQPVPSLWGYEDTLFFNEIEKAGIPTAIVGSSWLHHFGSITLSALKQERGLSQRQGLSARDSHKLLHQSIIERKWKKFLRKRELERWRAREMAEFGMTLHGQRENGQFKWR